MNRKLGRVLFLLPLLVPASRLIAQRTHPPDYRGVRSHVPGVFVTPVPGAPFTGTVEILAKEVLEDGSTYTRHGTAHIARDSRGVIYNEMRQMEPPDFKGEPPLLSAHIFNPQTRLNTFLNPFTRIARQSVWQQPPNIPNDPMASFYVDDYGAYPQTSQDIGTETVAGLVLHGTRKQHTVPAKGSGTGADVTVTDDYWYSEDLKVFLVLRHNDPRTGEQIVAVTDADRKEPDKTVFAIPAKYKIVDETPVADDGR